MLLARLTNLPRLELPSQRHHDVSNKKKLTQMSAASAEKESADQGLRRLLHRPDLSMN